MHGGGPGFESPRLHRRARAARCVFHDSHRTLTTHHGDLNPGCPDHRCALASRWSGGSEETQVAHMRAMHAPMPRSERMKVDVSAVTWRGHERPRVTGGHGPRGGRRRVRRSDEKLCEYGRTVDALAPAAEEGRGHAAKCAGEGLAPGDPAISEWGNPAAVMGRHPALPGGHRGN